MLFFNLLKYMAVIEPPGHLPDEPRNGEGIYTARGVHTENPVVTTLHLLTVSCLQRTRHL